MSSTDRRTDRQTDRRTDKVNPVYPPSNFVGRGYNDSKFGIVERNVPLISCLYSCFCILHKFHLLLAATKQLYEWYFLSVCPSVRLSVCPSVRLSVRLSHLFDYVTIIVSSWNFQELSHWTRVRSMQKVKVRGQRSRSQRSRPKFSFPDCNSSLNSHMMMKWYI